MKHLLVSLLLIAPCTWIHGQPLSFDNFIAQLNNLEKEKNFTEAQSYLLKHESTFPDYWFLLSKEKIYLNEKLMKHEENLDIYKQGHIKGFFYFLHPAIPRYKPYLEFSGFDDLVKTDRKLHEKALEHSSTLYKIDLPSGFSPKKSYPLFIIFHGGNSNFQRVGKHWNAELIDDHYIKLYLQSYRCFDSGSFTWRAGDPRSDRDIIRIFKEICLSYPVDTSNIIVSGMSAGATYAIGMSLRGIIPVSGIIAFCPGLPGEIASNAGQDNFRSDIRAYLLGGENDYYREHQEKLCRVFDQAGLDFLYVIEDEMSHQYPENEANYISEGIHFIMEQ